VKPAEAGSATRCSSKKSASDVADAPQRERRTDATAGRLQAVRGA
jgi:hypothetical protein